MTFLEGSFLHCFFNNCVLKVKKSLASLFTSFFNPSEPFFLEKLSGSSPSGKRIILTFNPSLKIKSIPLKAAFKPASSPS